MHVRLCDSSVEASLKRLDDVSLDSCRVSAWPPHEGSPELLNRLLGDLKDRRLGPDGRPPAVDVFLSPTPEATEYLETIISQATVSDFLRVHIFCSGNGAYEDLTSELDSRCKSAHLEGYVIVQADSSPALVRAFAALRTLTLIAERPVGLFVDHGAFHDAASELDPQSVANFIRSVLPVTPALPAGFNDLVYLSSFLSEFSPALRGLPLTVKELRGHHELVPPTSGLPLCGDSARLASDLDYLKAHHSVFSRLHELPHGGGSAVRLGPRAMSDYRFE